MAKSVKPSRARRPKERPHHVIKIDDELFLAILRENCGLYARTARAISEIIGSSYSRQSVRERAEKFPEVLADIQEQNLDVAESGLHSLMKSANEPVQLRAIELYLKTKGKRRGYVERTEVEHQGEVKMTRVIEPEPDPLEAETIA